MYTKRLYNPYFHNKLMIRKYRNEDKKVTRTIFDAGIIYMWFYDKYLKSKGWNRIA